MFGFRTSQPVVGDEYVAYSYALLAGDHLQEFNRYGRCFRGLAPEGADLDGRVITRITAEALERIKLQLAAELTVLTNNLFKQGFLFEAYTVVGGELGTKWLATRTGHLCITPLNVQTLREMIPSFDTRRIAEILIFGEGNIPLW